MERIAGDTEGRGRYKEETESTAQSVTSARQNDERRQQIQIKVKNRLRPTPNESSTPLKTHSRLCIRLIHRMLTKLTRLLIYLLGPLAMSR